MYVSIYFSYVHAYLMQWFIANNCEFAKLILLYFVFTCEVKSIR